MLQTALATAERKVDEALRDDFDTPTAMAALIELVKATNVYLETPDKIVYLVLRNVAAYVTRMLKVFGLILDDDIGFPMQGASGGDRTEETLTPVLDALMKFRSAVRDKARANDMSAVLQECDTFRDEVLPPLSIRLEDKPGGKSVWKLEDPEERKPREQEALRKQEENEQFAAKMAKRMRSRAWLAHELSDN